MIGKTLSHFRILERIGAGGMGDVYRAVDTRLDRPVALKVLPDAVRTDRDRLARFEREARAVASLSHPNILAIHEFGVEEGVPFAVMEILEGRTLREEIVAGSATPKRVLELARQIARGLEAAHRKSIVHRDLKPENLFLTRDGFVKILDFGLAKTARSPERASEVSTRSIQTGTGAVLGTIPYMSPEQIRGEPLDARTDLFALGVVLHEMLSGRHPFRRPSGAETMTAILRDDPARLVELVPGLGAETDLLVRSCLEKDRERRVSSAGELVARLDAILAAAPAPAGALREAHIDSLAVVPFRIESRDEDTEYLVDGITDTLIDNLSQLPRLRVMARSTVLRFRDGNVDPLTVARDLGVRAVLTGRLRQRGEVLSIRAELVDATDGTRMWGARFDRPAAELLQIEDEIAHEIADNLRFELSGEERRRIAKRPTESPEAHEAYLKGRHVWARWKTPEGMRMAIGFFERALELDPLYARAFAGLADSYSVLGNVKAVPPGEAYPKAKTLALQGLAIDDELAELHTSLGFVHRFWDWDWPAAEASFLRAIELNPGYSTAHRWYSHLLAGLGQHGAAVATATRALELDPLSLILHTAVGDALFYARRYDEAMTYYRKSTEMDPEFLPGHTDLARSLELAGRYDEAIEEFRTAEALAPKGPPEPSSGLAHVYARMGRRADALEIVDSLLALSKRRYVSPYGIASVYACLGEIETALDWLDRAYAEHDQTLVWVKVHPRLDPLRGHARFAALLGHMRL